MSQLNIWVAFSQQPFCFPLRKLPVREDGEYAAGDSAMPRTFACFLSSRAVQKQVEASFIVLKLLQLFFFYPIHCQVVDLQPCGGSVWLFLTRVIQTFQTTPVKSEGRHTNMFLSHWIFSLSPFFSDGLLLKNNIFRADAKLYTHLNYLVSGTHR